MAENITKVYLLNTPLESDYKHTLYFNSLDAQRDYFNSKVKFSFTDFSYQRKDNTMRIPKHFDDVYKCNYVMYQNTSYSNKWIYAFITNVEYINEDVTLIHIETDVIQTWLFDYTVKPSFIEREHVDDDTIGLHTFPENLECGEYEITHKSSIDGLAETQLVIGVNKYFLNDSSDHQVGISMYTGMYSGLVYYTIKNINTTKIQEFIKKYDEEGVSDSIVTMFLAPKFVLSPLINTDDIVTIMVANADHPKKQYELEREIYKSSYIPKNNKLNCYPYKYLLTSNNNGGSAIYQYEHFTGDKITFEYYGVLCPGCSIRLVPKNYKKVELNDEEGLNGGKYPICSWSSDEYTNWLTQNSVNVGLGIASGITQIVGGALLTVGTGGLGGVIGGGTIVGGISTIAQTLGQTHQASFTPPQTRGNTNGGDVVTTIGRNTFTFYGMSIKEEYLRIIDNYFDMFGYKINKVKTPNKNHRENYWFTKTIDVNISGDIPNKDMLKIKDCYNAGITFWKNPDNVENYSVSNNII